MRAILISDTHLQHNLVLPDGDLLIHAGDFSSQGKINEVAQFISWFGSHPHRHKVLIAGNHDFLAENNPSLFRSMVPEGVTYLNDSGTEIEGFRIWGSPIQPWFYDWAFNRQRGPDIDKHWAMIPEDTQILITHGPPFGILDELKQGGNAGCEDLRRRVDALQPALHVFGHIHEGHGEKVIGKTRFVNASVLDNRYKMTWGATVVDL